MVDLTGFWLPALSHIPTLLPTHPLTPIHAIHYIYYYSHCEESCLKSSSVSQPAKGLIKQQLKDCSSCTLNLVWLKSSTREPQEFQYFKLVFLKLPNMTTWSVFQNQVIYNKNLLYPSRRNDSCRTHLQNSCCSGTFIWGLMA